MTINLQAEIEIIKQFYQALNQNDVTIALELFDSQIVRIELLGPGSTGPHRGLSEMKAHIIQGRSTWAEGACMPEHFQILNNKILVSVFVRVRLKDQTKWLEGRTADVFSFKNDKIIEMHSFLDEQKATDWIKAQIT